MTADGYLVLEWCGNGCGSGWKPVAGLSTFLTRDGAERKVARYLQRLASDRDDARLIIVDLPPPPADACTGCGRVGCAGRYCH